MPVDAAKVYQGRLTEDYLVNQINGYRTTDSHENHKRRLQTFDELYRGDFTGLFPGENSIPDAERPLVENKLKNAAHDLTRLASEAKGAAVFMKDGEGKAATQRAQMRTAIAETIWHMSGGKRQERRLYLDEITSGYMAISVYFNDESEYPIFDRLNPRFCYPDVRNGRLQNMVYVETMFERVAAHEFPELGLDGDPKNNKQVFVVQYFDKDEVVQLVCRTATGKGGAVLAKSGHVLNRWEHKLGCVPVAFVQLDSADDSFHGLFDQLGGPMMSRNKIMRLLLDYMESMVHAPFERKGILNDDEPGPNVVYDHDDTRDDTFIRRVPPAAPAGAVFGVLQYLDGQEAGEAVQPPARVGVVRQSIASGSFVDSTQGTLSSLVYEMQDSMAELRQQANYIAFKIERKFLNKDKALYRAVGKKNTYKPETDMGDFYSHTIQYGASAGLNRAEAASRVLQDLGAGLIDKQTAREQIDYIDDVLSVQDRIDRENLANVWFQRFSADPNVPMSLLAKAIMEMGKDGQSLLDVVEKLAPEFVEYEKQQREAAQGTEGLTPPEGQEDALAEQEALAAGAIPQEIDFAPPPLQQQIVNNPF